jgi:hypothetical protein
VQKNIFGDIYAQGILSFNVTFEPGCRNNWHVHHKWGTNSVLHCRKRFVPGRGEAGKVLKTRRCGKPFLPAASISPAFCLMAA